MPYDDAYSLYYENRAIGQSTPKGYSLDGRYPFGGWSNQYFDNRAVGQSTMPMDPSKMLSIFDVKRKRAFTTGWTTPQQPANNVVVPTTVYGTTPAPIQNILSKIRIQHVVIILAIAALAIVLVAKK